MVEFINLTPHPVRIVKENGEEITIPPSGKVFRLKEEDVLAGLIHDIPVYRRKLELSEEDLTMFSDPSKIYIVSLPALMGLLPFADKIASIVVAPDTGKGAIRNEKGEIVGTKSLIILRSPLR